MHINYKRAPIVPLAFAKAALPKAGGLKGGSIPRIEASLCNVKIDPSVLGKYRSICGFSDSEYLPITYPHVLASSIHLGVMTQKKFPLKLLGLVHVRNVISQHRKIRADETLDISVYVDGHREVHNGIEFDLMTSVMGSDGKLAWEEVSTILSRGKSKGGKKAKSATTPEPTYNNSTSWKVPANIGRRYGINAGDINPIHLSALSAKLFGFPRAIAHGMWSLARCAAEMESEMSLDNVKFSIAFKLPVFLPATVTLNYDIQGNKIIYALINEDGSKQHLTGEVSY